MLPTLHIHLTVLSLSQFSHLLWRGRVPLSLLCWPQPVGLYWRPWRRGPSLWPPHYSLRWYRTTLHISNTHSQSIYDVVLHLTVFSSAYCTRVVVLCSIYLVYGCAVFTEVRLLPHHQQTTQRLSGEPRLVCVCVSNDCVCMIVCVK